MLHDAAQLARLLPRLPGRPRCEVIVANGDAADAAVHGMRRTGPDVVWVESEPGRGRQMNAGAARAAGTWLLFLHADALPDSGWVDEIGRAEAAGAVGGCFRLRIDACRWQARVIEAGVLWRVRWFGIAYGDSGHLRPAEPVPAARGLPADTRDGRRRARGADTVSRTFLAVVPRGGRCRRDVGSRTAGGAVRPPTCASSVCIWPAGRPIAWPRCTRRGGIQPRTAVDKPAVPERTWL